jgi:hypothetical protein
MSSSASRDLPDPEGPRISTARAPTSTAEAWMVGDGMVLKSGRSVRLS